MNETIPRQALKVHKAFAPLLEIRNLSKTFDGQLAVDDVNLTIYKGEIFALLGASGCGKSTLLSLICGLLPLEQGMIRINGKMLRESTTNVGYMLQPMSRLINGLSI